MKPSALAVALAATLVLAVSAVAAGGAPRARAHSAYGGAGSRGDVGVTLHTSSPTVIAASRAGGAPELLHSNVNVLCGPRSTGRQANTGMPRVVLHLRRGRYRFSARFTRRHVPVTGLPGAHPVNLTVTLNGTVQSASRIAGSVKVTGGCSAPRQSYVARLVAPRH